MFRPGPVSLAVLIWFFAEYMAFAFVASFVGFSGALLIGIATSLLGVQVLRRLGGAAMSSLRRQFDTGEEKPADILDGTLSAIGAILLILPGFISDVIGLGLLSPSVRGWIANRFDSGMIVKRGSPRRSAPDIIDLDQADWRQVGDTKQNPQRPRPTLKNVTSSDIWTR